MNIQNFTEETLVEHTVGSFWSFLRTNNYQTVIVALLYYKIMQNTSIQKKIKLEWQFIGTSYYQPALKRLHPIIN